MFNNLKEYEMSDLTKTIERIRNAKNVTKTMQANTLEFVRFIEKIMNECGAVRLLNGKYKLIEYTNASCDYCDLHIHIVDAHQNFYARYSQIISSTRESYCLNGDYSSRYNACNRDDYLELRNDVSDILKELESFAKERVALPELDAFFK